MIDDHGQRGDFAFRAAPAKKGAPTGDAVQVFREYADLGSGIREYGFVVRTSSLTSLTRTCSGKSVKVCSVTIDADGTSTTAVDLQEGAVVPTGGLGSLRIHATDNAEPSGGSVPPDSYAVAALGPKPFAIGGANDQRLLVSGNIRVPS